MLQRLIIFLLTVLHLALFTFSKGCCGGRKPPHEKVDQGLCKCHVWPEPLVVKPPPLLTQYATHLPAPCLVNLVSLHWFCVQQRHVFDISVFPVFGVQSVLPCLTLVKTFVSRDGKVFVFYIYSFVKADVTVRPALSPNVMPFGFRSWLWL